MWIMKCFVVPIIAGNSGILTKDLISGNSIRKALNRFFTKTAALGISHIIRKVLPNLKLEALVVGCTIWFKRKGTEFKLLLTVSAVGFIPNYTLVSKYCKLTHCYTLSCKDQLL